MSTPISLDTIPDLCRIENVQKEDMQERCMDMTHSIYPHDKIFGEYCTIQEYIHCPPQTTFEYLAETSNLLEWTYSLRDMTYDEERNLYEFTDAVGGKTKCYCRTVAHRDAMTVDYHCAWDQGDELWMIYLMRVIPAEPVLNKPGSVVLWTNCHHPYYEKNPYPQQAPADRKIWVGDMWPMFYAGHWIEMQNLKKILEHRHANLR